MSQAELVVYQKNNARNVERDSTEIYADKISMQF